MGFNTKFLASQTKYDKCFKTEDNLEPEGNQKHEKIHGNKP